MNTIKIKEIFERFYKEEPNPTTELQYSSPFELLIAVILSAQSTDKGVNKATPALFEKYNTPSKMLSLGEENLKEYIKTIGLYNSKAKNIIKTCEILTNKYNEEIPSTLKELVALPGVGQKTANVVLNTLYDLPNIAVDTHVFRVSNRTNLAPGKNVIEVENGLNKIVPDKFKSKAHHWLVLHGRYVCKAKKPSCGSCLIEDLCEYKDKEEI
ncbi:MAG: endonuclease III [Psittacicella sp.]